MDANFLALQLFLLICSGFKKIENIAQSVTLHFLNWKLKTKLNSVALVHERTILTERWPPVGQVSANFRG
jgi:hypothetical protein